MVLVAQAPFGRLPLRIQAARVGGVEIPNAKRIEFSLRYVYGIGPTTAKAILADTVSTLMLKSPQFQLLPNAITPSGEPKHTYAHSAGSGAIDIGYSCVNVLSACPHSPCMLKKDVGVWVLM